MSFKEYIKEKDNKRTEYNDKEAKEIRIKEITIKIYEEMKEEIIEKDKDKEKEKNNKEGKKIKI